MALLVMLLISAAVVVLAALGYISWIFALPALGLVVAVALGYAMRRSGPG